MALVPHNGYTIIHHFAPVPVQKIAKPTIRLCDVIRLAKKTSRSLKQIVFVNVHDAQTYWMVSPNGSVTKLPKSDYN